MHRALSPGPVRSGVEAWFGTARTALRIPLWCRVRSLSSPMKPFPSTEEAVRFLQATSYELRREALILPLELFKFFFQLPLHARLFVGVQKLLAWRRDL